MRCEIIHGIKKLCEVWTCPIVRIIAAWLVSKRESVGKLRLVILENLKC